MTYTEVETTVENLRLQHARLEAALKKEERHIWKNMIRIEQLKKEKLRKKDELLRRSLRSH